MTVNLAPGRVPRKNYAAVNQNEINSLLSSLPQEIRVPISQALTKIFAKQAIDERLNYDAIERSLGEVFSGHAKGDLASISPTSSDYYHVLFGGWLYSYATLTTVGSSDTTVDIYRSVDDGVNFTLLETITVVSGSHVGSTRLSSRVEKDDLLYYDISSVGTGAAGLLMQLLIQNYNRARVMGS